MSQEQPPQSSNQPTIHEGLGDPGQAEQAEVRHIAQTDFDKSPELMTEAERIAATLRFASEWTYDGDHHKMWTIDQMTRVLTGCPIVKSEVRHDSNGAPYTFDELGESEAYKAFVAEHRAGEEGPETYDWDTGIAP